jgi:hypothetical protein
MSLIKHNAHLPKGLTPTKTATPKTKPQDKGPEVKSNDSNPPQESFVPSVVRPQPTHDTKTLETPTEQVSSPQLKTPRAGSDMAIMLEDMETAKKAGGKIELGANGSLVVFEEPFYESVLTNMVEAEFKLDGAHQNSEGHSSQGHGHANDARLGVHLGTEVVEKIGHSAHHPVSHVAEAGHAATTIKANTASHVSAEVKSQLAHTVATSSHAVKGNVAETLQDVVQATQSGHHKVSKVAHEVVKESAAHGGEAAHHLSTGLVTALGASAAVSGVLGGVMLYAGSKELAAGVKEKDGEKMAEGIGGLAVGARSVAASTVMASMVTSSSTVAQIASVASQTLTPLGIVHGAIDVGLGVKDLVDKKPVDGLLKIGFGTSVIAGAVVGGIPLTLLALGFLGVKVGRGIFQAKKAKKLALADAPKPDQSTPPPAPVVGSGSDLALKDTKT